MSYEIDDNVVTFPLQGVPGAYWLMDLPCPPPVSDRCIGTGWSELDEIYKMYAGQLTVITGKPGSGKSTFVFNLIANLQLLHGIRSFVFAPENESEIFHTLRRIVDERSATAFPHFAKQVIVQSVAHDYGNEPRTIQWVLDRAAQFIESQHIELVVIDPWNELERSKPKDMLLTDYINDCLQLLKTFTRHFQTMTIICAHPTKAGAADPDRVPTLADIEGSMNWWNKCDNGLVVHRNVESNITTVISQKVRERGAGALGRRNFFVHDTGLFDAYVGKASDHQPAPASRYRRNPD